MTVWSETRSPRTQFCTYYASVLTALGFNVTIKVIADTQYFPTIGTLSLNAQTGFADWNQDFPNPGDFYLLLDKNSIQPTNNQNFSQVNDPKIQSAITKLDAIPASQLKQHAADGRRWTTTPRRRPTRWSTATRPGPKFASTRINYKALVVQPTYGWDWTSIKLAK